MDTTSTKVFIGEKNAIYLQCGWELWFLRIVADQLAPRVSVRVLALRSFPPTAETMTQVGQMTNEDRESLFEACGAGWQYIRRHTEEDLPRAIVSCLQKQRIIAPSLAGNTDLASDYGE